MVLAVSLFTVTLIIVFVLVVVPILFWILHGLFRMVRRSPR